MQDRSTSAPYAAAAKNHGIILIKLHLDAARPDNPQQRTGPCTAPKYNIARARPV